MDFSALGITTADIYDRESDSELDELLDSEYYPTSSDEESEDEIRFSRSFIIMSDILQKLFNNKNYDSEYDSDSEDDMSDDESPYNSDSDADLMSVDSDEEELIIAEPAGESLPVKIDWELLDLEIESKGKILL